MALGLFELHEILGAPCLFCKYNGPRFYSAHTHKKECPFYEIGGSAERKHALVVWAKKGMLKVSGYPKISIEDFMRDNNLGPEDMKNDITYP